MTQDEPLTTLRLYGLDELLTEEDDPRLWAAVVAQHWPRPDDPKLKQRAIDDVPRFSFGIGQVKEDNSPGSKRRRVLITKQYWLFERVDVEHFRPVQGKAELPHFILDISRPSVKTDLALVKWGGNPAPLVGYGGTTVWKRQPDGSWVDTGEIVMQWRS